MLIPPSVSEVSFLFELQPYSIEPAGTALAARAHRGPSSPPSDFHHVTEPANPSLTQARLRHGGYEHWPTKWARELYAAVMIGDFIVQS